MTHNYFNSRDLLFKKAAIPNVLYSKNVLCRILHMYKENVSLHSAYTVSSHHRIFAMADLCDGTPTPGKITVSEQHLGLSTPTEHPQNSRSYNVFHLQQASPELPLCHCPFDCWAIDVNIEFFVVPDIESKNPISIRISVHSGI